MASLLQRFRDTGLNPGCETQATAQAQVIKMVITRANGDVEERICYYHPNPFKRYWVRILLTLGYMKEI